MTHKFLPLQKHHIWHIYNLQLIPRPDVFTNINKTNQVVFCWLCDPDILQTAMYFFMCKIERNDLFRLEIANRFALKLVFFSTSVGINKNNFWWNKSFSVCLWFAFTACAVQYLACPMGLALDYLLPLQRFVCCMLQRINRNKMASQVALPLPPPHFHYR